MSSADMETVIDHTNELLFDVYSGYEEFSEVTTLVKGALLSFSERAVEKERRRSAKMLKESERKAEKTRWDIERITQTMELDIDHIKSIYDNPVVYE
jgi:hypothetical protein